MLFSAGSVKCWGKDDKGILLSGTEDEHILDPSTAPLLDFGTTRRVARLESGNGAFCVIFEDGKARCWGRNLSGVLGIGSLDSYGDEPDETLAALPDLPFDRVLEISPARVHTCALVLEDAKKKMYCWGDSYAGQLGVGTTAVVDDAAEAKEVDLPETDLISMRAAGSASCALFEPGHVICWGNNASNGLSGAGNTLTPNLASDVLWLLGDPIDRLASKSMGPNCTFDAPNSIFCWGSNDGGQLGTPYLIDGNLRAPVPIYVGDKDFVDFQASQDLSCGLSSDGRIFCFGAKEDLPYAGAYQPIKHPHENWAELPHEGAVDLGDFDEKEGLDRAIRIFLSRHIACAEMEDGSLRCWGMNKYGQVGYGFGPEDGPDLYTDWEAIGDDETPADAYARIGNPALVLW